MSEKSTVYECVDREHDAWRCRACGYIENFEADGPTENGWHFCPGCGREIIVEAVNPCPFDNDNCMCQFCEITQVSQIHRYSAFLKRCDDIR